MKKDVSIEGSTKNVEIFDTAIAIMAGLMIIPAVFAFSGGDPDTLQAGPSLMFITLPKVFDSMGMGAAGKIFKVEANVGQAVKKGDAVIILEAMKMEIPVVAPEDGTVASIDVAVGDTVEAGAVLATLN